MAFILCVVFFAVTIGSMGVGASLYMQGTATAVFENKSYRESGAFYSDMYDQTTNGLQILQNYKELKNIKAGKTVNSDDVDGYMWDLYYYGSVNIMGENIYTNSKWYENGGDSETGSYNGVTYDSSENSQLIKKFREVNSEELAKISQLLIASELSGFNIQKKAYENISGFNYYIADGENSITNVPSGTAISKDSFMSDPAYMVYEKGQLKRTPNNKDNLQFEYLLSDNSNYDDNLVAYISFDQGYMERASTAFNYAKDAFTIYLPIIIGSALLTLLLFIYLIITTGKKDEFGNIKLFVLDKIYTEIQLVCTCIVLGLGLGAIDGMMSTSFVYFNPSQDRYIGNTYSPFLSNGSVIPNPGIAYTELFLYGLLISIIAAFGLWFTLSLIRLLKAKSFLKQSLLWKVGSALGKAFKDIYNGGSVMRKVVLIALCICLLSATIFLAPVVLIAVLIFAPKWVNKYNTIRNGISEVKNGNLSHKIPVTGNGELDSLAKDINDISEASSIAIQNELKNQRMKTDLISNVSHDLKTPLTSIITYIDLLKTEGLDNSEAPKYLDILEQKANRLKNLTEDLFEAAKASSGAIPVKREKVEVLSLINQGLGELSRGISGAGLNFIISCKREKYYVNADGQLLWRVIENLLGNVIKYAQENSRVYINVSHQQSRNGIATVLLEIKNISKQELNMDPDELMERFKRGDDSRTDEGSGLGLAIAKDLVKLQDGWFEIKIDGDLFKVTVLLNAYNEENEENENYEEKTQEM